MSRQTGLADRARFEAFSLTWRDSVLKEAKKWCSDVRAQELLTDAVLAEFRQKYAYSKPPADLDYYFRAQVCLVYSITGQNIQKLQQYYDDHALPEEEEEPPREPVELAPQAEVIAAPPAPAPAPPPAKAQEAAPPSAKAPAPAAAPAPAPAPAQNAAEAKAPVTPDTFLDPVRTTFWTPDSEKNKHVVREVELPDDEEEDRSAVISFINTILFLFTAGAFGFCVYETGFFQYLLQ